MSRRKATFYVEEDVLRAAKAYAARKDLRDSEVIEKALRRFLGIDMFESVWDRNGELDEDDALQLAQGELRSARAARSRRQ